MLAGYTLRRIATGLVHPTAIALSADQLWVAEAGLTQPPGQTPTPPQIKEVLADGTTRLVLADSSLPQGSATAGSSAPSIDRQLMGE